MRAAMVACSVAGTLTSAASAVDMYAPRCPCSTPRSASSRTISSAKNGLPAALLGDRLAQPDSRGVRPEQFRDQCRRLRITQRRKGYRLRTVHPRERPLVVGPVGDQHQRGRLRDNRQEIGQHRLADLIDPMGVLNDIDRRDLRANEAAFTKAVNRRRRASGSMSEGNIGVGDAQQIIK